MNNELEKRNSGYINLNVNVPFSLYKRFKKACTILEGKDVEEKYIPAYVQSVVCKALQDFIRQHTSEPGIR